MSYGPYDTMTERHGRVRTVCTLTSMCAVGIVASGFASIGAATHPNTVQLVPAPTALARGCTDAARRLGIAVQCPTRVPRGWSPRVCAGCNGTFSATGWFPAPRGYVGQPGEATGHFTVWGGFNANGAETNGTFTFNLTLTGSDGSKISHHEVEHFDQRPDGTVHEFFRCH